MAEVTSGFGAFIFVVGGFVRDVSRVGVRRWNKGINLWHITSRNTKMIENTFDGLQFSVNGTGSSSGLFRPLY